MADRRSSRRTDYRTDVLLRLNDFIKGSGYTKNISAGGVRISSHELFSFLGQTIEDRVLNKPVEINFTSETLTLQGTITRIDEFEEELVISISQTSNPVRWTSLCA